MPIYRRLPRPGLRQRNRAVYAVVNVEKLNEFRKGSTVGPESRAAGLIKKRGLVKVLGSGELTKDLKVRAHAFQRRRRGAHPPRRSVEDRMN
jgi:large subunit ribosomal protein L15